MKAIQPIENRVTRNDSVREEKIIDQLQNLLTTEKVISDTPLENMTSLNEESGVSGRLQYRN